MPKGAKPVKGLLKYSELAGGSRAGKAGRGGTGYRPPQPDPGKRRSEYAPVQ